MKTSWSPERCVVWFLAIPSGWAAWTCKGAVSSSRRRRCPGRFGACARNGRGQCCDHNFAHTVILSMLFPLRNQLRNTSNLLVFPHVPRAGFSLVCLQSSHASSQSPGRGCERLHSGADAVCEPCATGYFRWATSEEDEFVTSSTRLPGLMADIPATASTFERREMTERRAPPYSTDCSASNVSAPARRRRARARSSDRGRRARSCPAEAASPTRSLPHGHVVGSSSSCQSHCASSIQ